MAQSGVHFRGWGWGGMKMAGKFGQTWLWSEEAMLDLQPIGLVSWASVSQPREY